jgi:hypothetical protein
MRNRVTAFGLVVLAVLLGCVRPTGTTPPARAADEPQDLSGVYTYGTSTIFLTRTGELYEYREVNKDGAVWRGPAVYKDGILSASWLRADGGELGVSLLRVEKGDKGPRLVGTFGVLGDRKVQEYKPPCEFLRKLDK